MLVDNQDIVSLNNQLVKRCCETNLIDDIDRNGCLVNDVDSESKNDELNESTGFDEYSNELNQANVIGKEFDTPEDAYTFYKQYVFVHGFGIRKYWGYKNKITNEPYQKIYVCNKEGTKDLKGESSNGVSKKRRRDLRTGCKAKLRISKRKDGRWCVDELNDKHNHDLTKTPTKVIKHGFHAKFHSSMACKSLMLDLGSNRLRPSCNL